MNILAELLKITWGLKIIVFAYLPIYRTTVFLFPKANKLESNHDIFNAWEHKERTKREKKN